MGGARDTLSRKPRAWGQGDRQESLEECWQGFPTVGTGRERGSGMAPVFWASSWRTEGSYCSGEACGKSRF